MIRPYLLILVTVLLNSAKAQVPVQPGEGPVVVPDPVQPGEGPAVPPPLVQPGEGPVIIDSRQEQKAPRPLQPVGSLLPENPTTEIVGVPPTRGSNAPASGTEGTPINGKYKRQFGDQKQPISLQPVNSINGPEQPLFNPNSGLGKQPTGGVPGAFDNGAIPLNPRKDKRQDGQSEPPVLPPSTPNLPSPGTIPRRFWA